MVFEIGKFYKHTTGQKLSIIAEIETTVYGKCLLAEDDYGRLHPAGTTEENAINYKEITKEEWLKSFGVIKGEI